MNHLTAGITLTNGFAFLYSVFRMIKNPEIYKNCKAAEKINELCFNSLSNPLPSLENEKEYEAALDVKVICKSLQYHPQGHRLGLTCTRGEEEYELYKTVAITCFVVFALLIIFKCCLPTKYPIQEIKQPERKKRIRKSKKNPSNHHTPEIARININNNSQNSDELKTLPIVRPISMLSAKKVTPRNSPDVLRKEWNKVNNFVQKDMKKEEKKHKKS